MQDQLRHRWPVKSATKEKGQEVVYNNFMLGDVINHWFNHKGKLQNESPVKLFGSNQTQKKPVQHKAPPKK